MSKKGVILLSGGLDSATVLAIMRSMNYEIYALTFNYLQNHSIEVDRVGQLIKQFNIKQHKIINIDLRTFGASALTDNSITVPKYNSAGELQNDIPVTYVPARNTIFLSYALGFAEVQKVYDIFIGVNSVDYANYPDCRTEFIKSFESMANLATAAGVSGNKINIYTPLIKMNKAQIIAKGIELGVDYSTTISCYDPTDDGLSCASCHACLIRIEGFRRNNINDPISYIT